MFKVSRLLVNCYRNRIVTRNIQTRSAVLFCQQDQEMKRLEKYTLIYRFPYIRVLATINRMKLYQTIFASLAIPTSIFSCYMNFTSIDAVIFITALSVAGYLPLFGLSYLFKEFVGFIYYNKQDDTVRVAFIDSWGKRKDAEFPRSDLVPFSELPVSMTDGLYLKLSRFSTQDVLKCSVKYGFVLDNDLFKKVFN